jgi:nitrous oxidase accessory protein NosD
MSVDISRISFAPRKNYAGPVEQQGRVRLDADANEAWAIQDRRWRSETYDILDRVALPADLPDSFRIDVAGGEIVIQPGRIYVDGLQAENHGVEPFEWSTVLAELRGTGPVPFAKQPYRPGVTPGPLAPGRHIIYLDVWQRTVTYLEDPALIEPAVGVDTTARVQTIWQVRDLADAGSATCATPDAQVPGWAAAVAPSAGRLWSRAHTGAPQTDPCLLPPGSGYTGLENRLYRVEIHDEQPAGTFRFKWAAHNATVATAIRALPAAEVLRVARVAKDDVMRFGAGDWVEITDDRAELEGTPGVFRQILSVDDAAQTITLTAAVPAGVLVPDGAGPELDQALHPRVRRWDQRGVVRDSAGNMLVDLNAPGSAGLIPVPPPGTWVQLHDGVEVRFDVDPAGGRFRPGDYWLFTARTSTREVEELVAAPPSGIHHHYCRLAVVDQGTGAGPVVVEDCRPHPAAVGCCTMVVQPGESIQAAIDALPDAGGCVCLKVGVHEIRTTLVIQRDNVTLHGESLGALVRSTGESTLLAIAGASGVRVHDISWEHGEAPSGAPMISIQKTDDTVLAGCRLRTFARASSIGVLAVSAEHLQIVGCDIEGASVGAWIDRGGASVTVSDNRFVMADPGGNTPSTVAILGRGLIGPLTAERNSIERAVNGIILNDRTEGPPRSLAERSRIAANRIDLVPALDGVQSWGIDVAAADAVVADNAVRHGGSRVTGIRVTGDGDLVHGNTITSAADAPGLAVGIVLGFQEGDTLLPVERVTASANRIDGPQHGIAVLAVSDAIVSGNFIGRRGQRFGLGIGLSRTVSAQVTGNGISNAAIGVFAVDGQRARIAANTVDGGGVGIAVAREAAPALTANRVTGLRTAGVLVMQAVERCDIIENRVVHCGFAADIGTGIGAFGVLGELHVEANEVMNTGLAPTADGGAATLARGIAGDLILEARVESNLVTYSNAALRPAAAEDRALQLGGMLEYVITLGRTQQRLGFAVQIANNKFIGSGATALVELLSRQLTDTAFIRFERVQFSGNYCAHVSMPFNDAVQAATVSLVGRVCSVSGNHVKASTPRFRSYHFHGMPGPFVGNVSHADNWGRTAAQQFPNPEPAFNMIVS